MKNRILVWDLPTRLFHWLLVLSFTGAWLTAESERYREVHVMLGYSLLGLIAFRLVWGVAGSRYARFSEFVCGPAAVLDYLKSMLAGRPNHYVGHNPAGALAIIFLLLLGIASAISGWMSYQEIGGEWLEEAHELLSNLMLLVVGVHIVGVIVGSLAHRENLARAMFTGYKQGEPGQAIKGVRWLPALLLLAVLAASWGLWFNDRGAALQSGEIMGRQGSGIGGTGMTLELARHGDDGDEDDKDRKRSDKD